VLNAKIEDFVVKTKGRTEHGSIGISEKKLIRTISDSKIARIVDLKTKARNNHSKEPSEHVDNGRIDKGEGILNEKKHCNSGTFVPKIEINSKLLDIPEFQDEFMQNINEFSQSWRKLIQEQKRFD
jgi:hypothetical protein